MGGGITLSKRKNGNLESILSNSEEYRYFKYKFGESEYDNWGNSDFLAYVLQTMDLVISDYKECPYNMPESYIVNTKGSNLFTPTYVRLTQMPIIMFRVPANFKRYNDYGFCSFNELCEASDECRGYAKLTEITKEEFEAAIIVK